MSQEMIHVCVISDANYHVPTTVALTSLKANLRPEVRCCVHYVCTSGQGWQREVIEQLSEPGFDIRWVEAQLGPYAELKEQTHVAVSALVKFDLPYLLPEVDKVLYLDGDILVTGDVAALYATDLTEHYMAAVRDMGGEETRHLHELVGVPQYFNSGVMLLNLEQMRCDELPEKLLRSKLQSPPTWTCMDQDVINDVMRGRVLNLPPRYNAMIPLFQNPMYGYTMAQINKFYGCDYADMGHLAADAVIIHFAGESYRRPWAQLNGSFAQLWQYYYLRSPFRTLDPGLSLLHWPFRPMGVLDSEVQPVTAKRIYRLLGCLPLLTVEDDAVRRSYRLFGCLPLLVVRKRQNIWKWCLFGCLPLLSVKYKSWN
ncbi:MAG: glycosyltransferase family 8 protein [Akkermansia sp.]|nr:glycosyltransferase family 8 protein [Akkermansia sp.]